jgi:predicted PurR-regulated permease PerM
MIKIPLPISKTKDQYTALEILQMMVLISVILYFGKTLLIPLSFAGLISFILFPFCKWLENNGLNKSAAIFIGLLIVSLLFISIIYLLFKQFIAFSDQWQMLKTKLLSANQELYIYFENIFGISKEKQTDFLRNALNNSGNQVFAFIGNTANSFSQSIFSLIIIPVFTALILFHRTLLTKVLYQIFPKENREIVHEILVETIHEYYNFIKGMLIVYLAVGILNSIGLAIIGIPHPILFGFIASILTFIPYVGIMISALLPITISWITFNSIWYPIGVMIVFGIVQLLEANIIFPMAVGSRLKINTLVIIIMIILGGILWGGAGMILFIPFVSILKLIADRTESLKSLSMLLGAG